MDLIKRIETLERLHKLILHKRTGTPAQLAQRLDMSERCMYGYIKLMRTMGAPVVYCKSTERYYYDYPVEFSIGFTADHQDVEQIIGGKSCFFNTLQDFCSAGIYL